jgi:diguanylate cyclase (GGDEF)-like protein/PAS domain S-box-containing protein
MSIVAADGPRMYDNPARDPVLTLAAIAGENAHLRSTVDELDGVWAGINLLGVAVVTSITYATLPLVLLVGWASFVLLNVCVGILIRCGRLAFLAEHASGRAQAERGVLGITGFAWGVGLAWCLPALPAASAASLAGTLFAVLAVALLGVRNDPSPALYFALAASSCAVVGMISDGRFLFALPWLSAGLAALALASAAQWRRYRLAFESLHAVRALAASIAPLDPTTSGALFGLRRAARELLRDRRVLRTLSDAVIVVDAADRIEYVNPVAEVMLGADAESLLGNRLDKYAHLTYAAGEANQMTELFAHLRATRHAQTSQDRAQLTRRDGIVYGVDFALSPLFDESGAIGGASLVLRDVTARRQRAETVSWHATHDVLTGMINRAELETRLKKLVYRHPRDNAKAHCLLYLDIDRFKFINDSYGHAAGDYVLKTMSDLLRTRVRGADTLARIGGDEFCALLYSCSTDKACLIGEGLRTAVDQHPFSWEGVNLPVSISIGVIAIDPECRSVGELLRAADVACYGAKHGGRNRVQLLANDNEGAQRERDMTDLKEIQGALASHRLELIHHPLQPLRRGLATDLGVVRVGLRQSSGDYMNGALLGDLITRFHLYHDVDRYVVKAALDAMHLRHPAVSHLRTVLVPLAAGTLADDRLLEHIIDLVRAHDADPGSIGFILPAVAFGEHRHYARYFAASLKQQGCVFMVDDLGFVGDSFAAVKTMQIDLIGIRAALVRNMPSDSADYEAVLGITRVAHALGMKTVAGGAEHRSVRAALANVGVDFAQGRLGSI